MLYEGGTKPPEFNITLRAGASTAAIRVKVQSFLPRKEVMIL
jgi:hypothetical protein